MKQRNQVFLIVLWALLLVGSCSSDESNPKGAAGEDSAAAQAPGSADTARASGDWLVYNLSAEPATLNPITATDVYESIVNSGNIYETLLKRDNETLELVPLLAESWEISEDKLRYTFKLRKDVRWHDGVPFTAEDVVFSFNKIKDPKVDAPHLRNYYKDVESVRAIGDHTVVFTYARPYFLALEFCGGMPIVPKHLFEKGNFNTHPAGRSPLGTGPYEFQEWETGKEIVLVRNEDYWGEEPHIDRIVFRIITDSTVALEVLKQGDLDLMSLTPIQWMKQTSSGAFASKYEKHSYFSPNYSYIGWNVDRPYFADKLVRRAMTHLVNRELFLDKIMYGLGVVVTNPFYINSPEYDDSIKPLPYDPKRARELLNEAGWVDSDGDGVRDRDGVEFEFEFLLPAGSDRGEKIATILKEELDKMGIAMEIRKIEWAVFTQRLQQRKFDAVTLGWSMGVETDPYQIWHSSQAEGKGSNFVGFDNERVDELIEEARTEFDRDKRIELYQEFSRIVHEEQPYTFLFCSKSLVAVSNRFRNVRVYPLGLDPLEWYVPKNLQKYDLQIY